jgi:uncharacterized protein (TIGR02391 family)
VSAEPPFPAGVVEQVARIIGDLYSGSELTRMLQEVGLRDDPGEGLTKWRRIAHALATHQNSAQTGKAVMGLITVAMRPDHTLSRKEAADRARDELNQVLSLTGLRVRDDGKFARATAAKTDSEALDRTNRLRTLLERRGAHPEVVLYCRADLVRSDYYEAVFEAIKGLGSRIRQLTGVDADGFALVEGTMAGREPMLRINAYATRTQRDEQLGVANLAKGLFSAFRNPAAHEPKLEWVMTEQDALDVLGTLSLIHRRLDSARLESRE